MNLIIKIGIQLANILYLFFKALPVREKVVYISRQSDGTPLDFQLLKEYMEDTYPDFENVILAKMLKQGIGNKVIYVGYMIKMMYHIATARAVILDTYCIPVSILKQRKDLVVVQIWHAMGAFKKFGYSILDKGEGTKSDIAKMMKMHENYSYVLTSSEICKPYFAEAFDQDIDTVKVIPLPRVDQLLDEKWKKETKERVFLEYPQLEGKKVIVYTPTFRKVKNEFENAVRDLLDVIDFSKYEVVIKLHPISKVEINDSRGIIDNLFTTQEMLTVADYVITDYSATMYEAALMKKPMFFYMYDYEDYTKNRDFYMELSNLLPGLMSTSAEQIFEAIKRDEYSLSTIEKFSNEMIEVNSKSCTQRICEFVVEEINNRRKK